MQNDWNEAQIDRRVFVVGCPRSGTTLIQAMLAGHSRVTSFPETKFFHFARPFRERGYFSRFYREPDHRKALFKTLEKLKRSDLDGWIPPPTKGFDEAVVAYRRILDRVTNDRGARIWVEKTPEHLHYLDLIAEKIPNVRFIHIVRDGKEVVASLLHSIAQGPKVWRWPIGDLGYYIKRWNSDVEISLKAQAGSHHHVVFYESLLEEPESEIRRACDFLDLEFEPGTLDSQANAELVLGDSKREPWRCGILEPLQREKTLGFDRYLSSEQQAFVRAGLLGEGDWRQLFRAGL